MAFLGSHWCRNRPLLALGGCFPQEMSWHELHHLWGQKPLQIRKNPDFSSRRSACSFLLADRSGSPFQGRVERERAVPRCPGWVLPSPFGPWARDLAFPKPCFPCGGHSCLKWLLEGCNKMMLNCWHMVGAPTRAALQGLCLGLCMWPECTLRPNGK